MACCADCLAQSFPWVHLSRPDPTRGLTRSVDNSDGRCEMAFRADCIYSYRLTSIRPAQLNYNYMRIVETSQFENVLNTCSYICSHVILIVNGIMWQILMHDGEITFFW